jgi:hypothetical protein
MHNQDPGGLLALLAQVGEASPRAENKETLRPGRLLFCLQHAWLTVQGRSEAVHARRAQENRRQGESLIWSLLSCCLECIWGLIEYVTKFATVRAAITGEAFLEAGRNVTDLLMRNFLKAYGAALPVALSTQVDCNCG